MSEIEFIYNQQITKIQAQLDEPFKDIINKYLQKSTLDRNHIFFILNGKPINPEEKVGRQIKSSNNENNILRVLVQYTEDLIEKQIFASSKDIICSECHEPCRIKTNNYKISLFGCKNNHINNIKIKDFLDTQKINISNIKCGKCKINNKGDSSNNEFYKCLTCNQNLCLLCKSVHQLEHYIINYDQINYFCEKHKELFIKFCIQCNKNICFSCENEHIEHDLISLNEIKPNINEIQNKLTEMKKELDKFNNNIKEIINILNQLNIDLNTYYKIINDILNKNDMQNRNYQMFQNINNINHNNNKIYQKLKKINQLNNMKDKLSKIIDLYEKINSDKDEIDDEINLSNMQDNIINNKNTISSIDNFNQMTIIHHIDKNKNKDTLKIFSPAFVEKNKNDCYLLINEQKYDLCATLNLSNPKNKNTLEINLIETKTISDMSNMFYECQSLISLPNIHEWNTINITNMSCMFYSCSSLESLPNISKWNIKNVSNLSFMFSNCSSLKSLPNISKWDTTNVTDMSFMFSHCSLLSSLPDISKWNTINVKNMSYMFYNCRSLKSSPDISKWNIKKVTNVSYMFYNCKSIESFPNISLWNIQNKTKDSIFYGCNQDLIKKIL